MGKIKNNHSVGVGVPSQANVTVCLYVYAYMCVPFCDGCLCVLVSPECVLCVFSVESLCIGLPVFLCASCGVFRLGVVRTCQ